jgi:hypothetical protein
MTMSAHRLRYLLSIWLGLILVACGGATTQSVPATAPPAATPTNAPVRPIPQPENAGQTVEMSGLYAVGFEYARFMPCGSSEIWLVSWNSMDVFDRYDAVKTSYRQELFVRVRGVVKPLSAEEVSLDDYVAKLTDTALLEMRQPQPGDCK